MVAEEFVNRQSDAVDVMFDFEFEMGYPDFMPNTLSRSCCQAFLTCSIYVWLNVWPAHRYT